MKTLTQFFWGSEGGKKKTRKNKKKLNCSPIVKNSVDAESCLTPEIVRKIKEKYNEKNKKTPITETDPKKIWYALKERLSCDAEDCLLKQLDDPDMIENIKRNIFAPKHPPEWKDDPDDWLSNFDIEAVVKQYEKSNPEFKLLGPTTIDFDTKVKERGGKCVLEDLCTFSLEKFIKEKKTKIGVVLNLDKYYQSGSHWVSLFIDIGNKYIFFFDSANNPIPPEVWLKKNPKSSKKMKPLVNRIMEQGKALKTPIHFKFFNNRGKNHQRKNTECGMYSLFFIITLLTGKGPFIKKTLTVKQRRNLFLKNRIPDEMMLEYRKVYFNE